MLCENEIVASTYFLAFDKKREERKFGVLNVQKTYFIFRRKQNCCYIDKRMK